MLLARSLLFEAWFYISMAVMGVVLAPIAVASRRGALWACRLFARQALWMLALICGLRTELRGAAPEGEALIAAKHQSFLDILILVLAVDRPRFVMKQELVYAPIFGLYALRIGAEPVNRKKGGSALRLLNRKSKSRATEPAQTIIFPQGTRVAPGAEAPYRRGVAALYKSQEVACWPVALDTGRFWGRKSVLRRPGLAVVEFLEPIPPGLDTPELMRELETRIETASDALAAQKSS